MTPFEKLDKLKALLDSHRPLPKAALENLHEALVVDWTYHSNAIEGNTLTLKETRVVLEGITVGGKSLREHFEAINHRDAIQYVEELVRDQEPLSEWQIKNIHGLVLKNIDDDNAGRYRRINVTIAGARHRPPESVQLASDMEALISCYRHQADTRHPVERAARLHVDFVKIHPFTDGNGRTARLLTNLELMKNGFPAAILPVERRLAYYQALDAAHVDEDYEPFLELAAAIVEESFEPYWFALGISSEK